MTKDEKMIYEFANKIAIAMKELSSSHVYFIIQIAYNDFGGMAWETAEDILDDVIVKTAWKLK